MKTYTEEEVAKLLDTQRGNCWVAAYNAGIRDKDILVQILNAPEPGSKTKNKINRNEN